MFKLMMYMKYSNSSMRKIPGLKSILLSNRCWIISSKIQDMSVCCHVESVSLSLQTQRMSTHFLQMTSTLHLPVNALDEFEELRNGRFTFCYQTDFVHLHPQEMKLFRRFSLTLAKKLWSVARQDPHYKPHMKRVNIR